MCRVVSVTTEPPQAQLISDQEQLALYEHAARVRLEQIIAWTKLPTERTDWELERLLSELGIACQFIRLLRGEADLPF